MGDGVALGSLEFTDDTGEMNQVTVNLDPGGQKQIPLAPYGNGKKRGTATWQELGEPHNVRSVEFIAPDATKRLEASEPGAFILHCAAVHPAGAIDATGTERPPVPFAGPVLTYEDTRPTPAAQVMFRFTPDGEPPNVTQRPLNNGVLEHKDAPPGLYNVTKIEVTTPVPGSDTAPGEELLTSMTAETTSAPNTTVNGNVTPPPGPRIISA